nr:hypothetical protein [Tanacetum cinerariifolium]
IVGVLWGSVAYCSWSRGVAETIGSGGFGFGGKGGKDGRLKMGERTKRDELGLGLFRVLCMMKVHDCGFYCVARNNGKNLVQGLKDEDCLWIKGIWRRSKGFCTLKDGVVGGVVYPVVQEDKKRLWAYTMEFNGYDHEILSCREINQIANIRGSCKVLMSFVDVLS